MGGNQIVIYRARTAEDAHMLKNMLDEAGIRAMVTNDALADGAGTDILGWPSLARVVVDEDDALTARRIAVEFDRQEIRARIDQPAEAAADGPVPNDWPTCPECGQRRTTSCVACGTSGSRFPPADPMPEETADSESPPVAMCICPTCDEPFVPRFLPTCEWCGHRFEGGDETSAGDRAGGPAEPADKMNHRVTMTMLAVIGFVMAVVAYFAMMWR